jgi:mRNA degradation ribonuclease J1/J2
MTTEQFIDQYRNMTDRQLRRIVNQLTLDEKNNIKQNIKTFDKNYKLNSYRLNDELNTFIMNGSCDIRIAYGHMQIKFIEIHHTIFIAFLITPRISDGQILYIMDRDGFVIKTISIPTNNFI